MVLSPVSKYSNAKVHCFMASDPFGHLGHRTGHASELLMNGLTAGDLGAWI